MYIANLQTILLAGSAGFNGFLSSAMDKNVIVKGSVMDYAVEKCLDKNGTVRCTKPFTVVADSCYKIEWSTEGTLSHTTIEVRDAGSNEIIYYRDTDGEWTAGKNELVYADFKPKIWGRGNQTVDYKISHCD